MTYHPDSDILWSVPLERLAEHCNPLTDDPWGVGLTRDMIEDALDNPILRVGEPVGHRSRDPLKHAGRIAWFACNDWEDPIEIDVGMPSAAGYRHIWPVQDGNHRLAAAILRADMQIRATICGDLDHAAELFGPGLFEIPEHDPDAFEVY